METLTQLKIRTDYNLHYSYVSKNMHNVLHNLRHATTFQLYATGGKKRFEAGRKIKHLKSYLVKRLCLEGT